MNIEQLTISEARSIAALFAGASSSPYEVGKSYFIRTVTMAYTGKLVAVTPQELILEDAAWIADTGRFADAMKTGTYSEVEPWPDGRKVIIGRGAIIDASQCDTLPRSQK